jgi:hypothetical protein
MDMKNVPTNIAATQGDDTGSTDLERRVAASEHAAGGDTQAETRSDAVRVAERNGIWTVTAAGTFLGDYLDEDAALAAAAQARGCGTDGGAADPWPRAEKEARP